MTFNLKVRCIFTEFCTAAILINRASSHYLRRQCICEKICVCRFALIGGMRTPLSVGKTQGNMIYFAHLEQE